MLNYSGFHPFSVRLTSVLRYVSACPANRARIASSDVLFAAAAADSYAPRIRWT